MAGNVNFDSLLATTIDNYKKTLTDNIFKSRPLLWWLTEKNSVRKVSGGNKIVVPLIYAQGQAGSYGEWDTISITPQEGISAAEYQWKQLFASIAISGLEEAQNNGEEQVINLLKAKVLQAEETLKAKLNIMLYADGAGNSGKDFDGLAAQVDSTGTVGNINSGTAGNEFWKSYEVAYVTATDTIPKVWGKAYNSASNGNDVIDGIFCHQTVYELYEAGLTPNVRYQDVKSANAGFSSLMFKQAPVYWDRDCPTGLAYGLNSKYIELVGHTDRWFKQSPFSTGLAPTGSVGAANTVDARYSIITTYGNLTISNRSAHFKITAIA